MGRHLQMLDPRTRTRMTVIRASGVAPDGLARHLCASLIDHGLRDLALPAIDPERIGMVRLALACADIRPQIDVLAGAYGVLAGVMSVQMLFPTEFDVNQIDIFGTCAAAGFCDITPGRGGDDIRWGRCHLAPEGEAAVATALKAARGFDCVEALWGPAH